MTRPFVDRRDRRVLWIVAGLALVTQVGSATLTRRPLDTPNLSTAIARQLVQTGHFAVPAEYRVRAPDGGPPRGDVRAYQLPGEPLFLATAFHVLPEAAWRYTHVPVTVLFVVAVAGVALLMAGRDAALLAGLVAVADPFTLVHGPVWDDVWLAAALEGAVLALVLRETAADGGAVKRAGWVLALVAVLSGWAAMTRLQSQLFLGMLGVVMCIAPRLRRVRMVGVAVLAGVALALGAWGARNTAALGTFFVGSTHDGKTLLESNDSHARAAILTVGTPAGMSARDPLLVDIPTVGELAEDRAARREAWAYIATHPGDVAKTALLKVAVSLAGVNPSASLVSARNAGAAVWSAALIIAGTLGLVRLWRGRNGAVAGLFGAASALGLVLTVGSLALGPPGERYRMPATLFLYVGAGAAGAWWQGERAARAKRQVTLEAVPRP